MKIDSNLTIDSEMYISFIPDFVYKQLVKIGLTPQGLKGYIDAVNPLVSMVKSLPVASHMNFGNAVAKLEDSINDEKIKKLKELIVNNVSTDDMRFFLGANTLLYKYLNLKHTHLYNALCNFISASIMNDDTIYERVNEIYADEINEMFKFYTMSDETFNEINDISELFDFVIVDNVIYIIVKEGVGNIVSKPKLKKALIELIIIEIVKKRPIEEFIKSDLFISISKALILTSSSPLNDNITSNIM